jgi:hypothetical protein
MAELMPLSKNRLIWGVGPPWEFIHDPEIARLLLGRAIMCSRSGPSGQNTGRLFNSLFDGIQTK